MLGRHTTCGGPVDVDVARCLLCDLSSVKRERDDARGKLDELEKKSRPLERVRW